MQAHNENGKQQPESTQDANLSEAWRALLGSQAGTASQENTQADSATQIQPQASDPWNALLHAQGMEIVDLQKIRLHELHPATSDDDVEHALDIMQEAAGSQNAQAKKPGEV